MDATIMNYRGGRHTQYNNQMILQINGVDTKNKASALVGKEIIWTSPGKEKKEIKGKITKEHGTKGALRALFERGMPGQSVGQKVKIL